MPNLDELLKTALEKLETITDEERDAFFEAQEFEASERAEMMGEDDWHVVGGAEDILARLYDIEPTSQSSSGPMTAQTEEYRPSNHFSSQFPSSDRIRIIGEAYTMAYSANDDKEVA